MTADALLYLDLLEALLEAVEVETEQGTIPESLKRHADAIGDVLVTHQVLAETRR